MILEAFARAKGHIKTIFFVSLHYNNLQYNI